MTLPQLRVVTRGLLAALSISTQAAGPLALSGQVVEVGGTLTSNAVWTAPWPVHVTNSVFVPSNITLTVESGVVLKLGAELSIVAQGGSTIHVDGTAANPVLVGSLNGDSNWARLGAEGAGATLTMRYVDADGDDLPDTWEMTYGLDFNDPGDAVLDSDDDRLSNEQEFRAGTEPDNADSVLKLLSPSPDSGGKRVSFQAAADRTYSVLYRDALNRGSWIVLTNVPAHSNAIVMVVVDPVPSISGQRLYRIVTPAIIDP